MITLTFGSAEAFAQALELLRANGVPVEPAELPENVTPIRPEDREAK